MRSASPCVDALLERAVDEDALLLRHLLGLLLAHRAAEEIGAAERVAGERLRDLHDLLLVDDDAVRRLEQLVDERVQLRDRRAAVLAVDEVLDHAGAERARAVERDGGDDVLEAVGLEVLEELLHPARLELEDALRLARGEERVGRACRRAGCARGRASCFSRCEVGARVDEAHRDVEHRQRLQAEEVELHEARGLDVVLVVLRDERARLLVLEDRHVIPERPLADDDAGRVLAGVAREPLELLRLRRAARLTARIGCRRAP